MDAAAARLDRIARVFGAEPSLTMFECPMTKRNISNIRKRRASRVYACLLFQSARSFVCLLLSCLAGTIAGVVFLHGYNIGHNDLKPENVIIFPGLAGTGPKAKLIDLGLALGE